MYIEIYNTTNSKYGYNKKQGGNNGKLNQDIIHKISEKNQKKIICITTNEIFDSIKLASEKYCVSPSSISECCYHRFLSSGKLQDGTPLQWLFYEEFLSGNYKIIKSPKDKRVICITTNKVFKNSQEAGKYYNMDYSHLYTICKNKKGYCGEFEGVKLQWLFYDDFLNGDKVEEVIDYRVVCINTNEVFNTPKQASEYYNLDRSSIVKCCKHKRKSCGKDKNNKPMRWEYYKNLKK